MKKIKIGIVGTNKISGWFSKSAQLSGCVELEAVYSRKLDTGMRFKEEYGVNKVYTDYEKMLSDADISAVYIASPTFCHYEHARLAILNNKHVLCEKAITVYHGQYLKLEKLSRERGVVLIEAMRPQFDPAYDTVRQMLGSIGDVRRVSFEFCQYSSRYDNFKKGIIENAFDVSMKNSSLSDIGVYPLNTLVSLFGKPDDISSYSVFLSNGFEGAGTVMLDYNGFIATVAYSKISDSVNPSLIEGEHGSITIDKISAPSEIILRQGENKTVKQFEKIANLNMKYEITAFAKMANGELSPKEYNRTTALTMELIDKIYEKSKIKFD